MCTDEERRRDRGGPVLTVNAHEGDTDIADFRLRSEALPPSGLQGEDGQATAGEFEQESGILR